MAKRRTIIEKLYEEEQTLLVSGGEDFQTCLDLFLSDFYGKNMYLEHPFPYFYEETTSD